MRLWTCCAVESLNLESIENLEVIAEGFNLLNRANLQLPNDTFGVGGAPARGFGASKAAADPRQIQFGMRLNF